MPLPESLPEAIRQEFEKSAAQGSEEFAKHAKNIREGKPSGLPSAFVLVGDVPLPSAE